MKMRSAVKFVVVAMVLGFAMPALAYENFIPSGTGYSPEVDSLPAFDSEAGQITVQADIYETENYRRRLEEAERDSKFRQFFSDANSTGSDTFIDY